VSWRGRISGWLEVLTLVLGEGDMERESDRHGDMVCRGYTIKALYVSVICSTLIISALQKLITY